MQVEQLSPTARRIVEARRHNRPVRSIVSDLCLEVGPEKWDGVVTPALVEIVEALMSDETPSSASLPIAAE